MSNCFILFTNLKHSSSKIISRKRILSCHNFCHIIMFFFLGHGGVCRLKMLLNRCGTPFLRLRGCSYYHHFILLFFIVVRTTKVNAIYYLSCFNIYSGPLQNVASQHMSLSFVFNSFSYSKGLENKAFDSV